MDNKLDSIDRKIIAILIGDGRTTASDIAGKIGGVSGRVIQYRINRLIQQNIITISAILNPRALGYPVRATIDIDIESGYLQQITKRLTEINQLAYIAYTFSIHDLRTEYFARDNVDVFSFISDTLPQIPGIRKSRFYLTPIVLKEFGQWFQAYVDPSFINIPRIYFNPIKPPIPFELNPIDISIIEHLIRDGRRPIVEIVRALGNVPARIINERIQALCDSEVMHISAIIRPETLGFPIRAEVEIEVESGLIMKIADELTKFNQTSYVACSIDGTTIEAEVYTTNITELYEFVIDLVESIPGIMKTETHIIPKVIKDWYEWRIPKSFQLTA